MYTDPSFTSDRDQDVLQNDSADTCVYQDRDAGMTLIWTSVILEMVVSTILNATLLFTVCCLKRSQRKPSHAVVGNLCLVDMTVSILYLPVLLASTSSGSMFCTWLPSLEKGMVAMVMWAMTLVGMDRYLFIVKHASYKSKMTPRRMKICVSVVWLIGCVFAVAYATLGLQTHKTDDCLGNYSFHYSGIYNAIYIPFCFVTPSVSILVLYGFIIKVAYRHEGLRKNNGLRQSASATMPRAGTSFSVSPKTSSPGVKVYQIKAAKILFIVLGTHFVLVAPYFVLNLLLATGSLNLDCDHHNVYTWLCILVFANSVFNPVYYGFCSRCYREPLVVFIRGNWKKRAVNSELAAARRHGHRLSIMADGSSISRGRSSLISDISVFSAGQHRGGFVNRDLLRLYLDSSSKHSSSSTSSKHSSNSTSSNVHKDHILFKTEPTTGDSTALIRKPLVQHHSKRFLALNHVVDTAERMADSHETGTSGK